MGIGDHAYPREAELKLHSGHSACTSSCVILHSVLSYTDMLRCNYKLISMACMSTANICCVINPRLSGCQLCLSCLLYCATTCKILVQKPITKACLAWEASSLTAAFTHPCSGFLSSPVGSSKLPKQAIVSYLFLAEVLQQPW